MKKETGFLENRIIYIRPIPRSRPIVGDDKKHIAYFKMENSSDRYPLKMDETGKIISPFQSEEELKYFSNIFGDDLNPYKKNNTFWNEYIVTITKTPELMRIGKKLDLSNPQDMLAYKVLSTWKDVFCQNWEDRYNGLYKYCFVDKDYEEKKATEAMNTTFKIGSIYGEFRDKPAKMREFINIYYQRKAKNKNVDDKANVSFMAKELKNIADTDSVGFLALYDDPNYEDMVFIAKAIDKGLILRKGITSYTIVGAEGSDYTYNELVSVIHKWAKEQIEPLYAKMLTIIE